MDNLTREMRICERAGFGVSYGKWKATQPIKTVPRKESGLCEWCGAMLPEGRKKFCGKECRNLAGYRGKRGVPTYSLDLGQEESYRTCAWCGKQFPLTNKRRIYCNVNCNAIATYYRKKEENEAKKARDDKANQG